MKCKNPNCNEKAEWCDKCIQIISEENKQLKEEIDKQKADFINELKYIKAKLQEYNCGEHKILVKYIESEIKSLERK